jgi:proline dehydrogenase
VKRHLLSGCYTAIATHDTDIINEIIRFTKKHRILKTRFEFQMLYGIAGSLQKQLVSEGYRVRVYTPYGKRWYPYFTRRIAERPANLLFVLKGLFRR